MAGWWQRAWITVMNRRERTGMKLRRSLAILSAKIFSAACKMAGKQGVTMAGKLAMKIDPHILRDLAGQVKGDIFVTCGTNGKTTTNNLLCSALEAEGKKVVCNHTGSNMLAGVAAAFVLDASVSGRLKADYAVIEVDEASTVRVFPHMKPNYMILTNLFRDQLDRYGEIDTTIDLLKRAMDMAPQVRLIVNGDDALSASLAKESGHDFAAYGISEQVFTQTKDEIREGRFCRHCGHELVYDFYHYSQIGVYHCPHCGFARPHIDYDARDIDMKNGLAFTVNGERIRAAYRGFYNIYNILAVYSALGEAGIKSTHFLKVLENYNPQNGRNELFTIGEAKVLLNLAKNPAGFNQNIAAVMEDETPKDIIIVINDNAQDGTDISWLWDVDFDQFKEPSINSITVSGIRCRDMRLRLKYVGISSMLEPDVRTAITKRLQDGSRNLYVLVNYTALYSTHQILGELEKQGGKR